MLAREHLTDQRTRDDLETQYLVLLMQRDAAIWKKRNEATLGKEAADEPEKLSVADNYG